ncbi:hypothetical protein SAMN05444679_103102 [Variovorax sp. CF079]|uniref:hypothetical protein n=1 Tax=Variovorax sp. CF079 TaxID=1882774 RepID=UPI00088E37F9|nr:hypothetical protein [Variovorax sp. CF079]SDC45149.1 hypothetical protein SAMN05444679_103102 [Variovorax sp. CF079]
MTVFAGLILTVALVAYVFWFSRSVRSVLLSIKQMTKALTGQSDEGWPTIRSRAHDVVKRYANLASTWLETEERVTSLPVGDRAVPVMFGVPRDIWSPRSLLSRRFNLDLAETVPNILVGVGLFFTFVFLTLALTDTTTALTQSQISAKDTEEAISNLLKVAGGKFLTSLAGLLASILWTGFSKRALRQIDRACDEVLEALVRAVPANGGELLVRHQVAVAAMNIEHAEASVELIEELLNEARDQNGTLKRFETDLAVSLAGAINPQMQAMTDSLVTAIDGLSNKLGAMNQDALEKMLTDFSAQLKQGTESEMAQLQRTLTQLADNLQEAGQSLGKNASGAADALQSAGTQLVTHLDDVTKTLSEGADRMVQAADSLSGSMEALDDTLCDASAAGKQGVIFVTRALEKAGETVDGLATVTAGLATAASSVDAAGDRIAEALDSAQELCREQRVVVQTVREFAPQATSAVERVAGLLEDASQRGLEALQHTRTSLNEATGALGKTLSSITEGVSIYSEQVAKLHLDMDAHLAKAVGSFDKGVSELADSIDELADVMNGERVIQ